MEENKMCKNCGKREHCKWVLKDTYHCDVWIAEEKTMKLEQKQGNKFKFRRID